jgi:hypothetical protein
MLLPTAPVPAGAGRSATSPEFPDADLMIDVGFRSRVRMEHVTRFSALMRHMEALLIGPDILMTVGDLGGEIPA